MIITDEMAELAAKELWFRAAIRMGCAFESDWPGEVHCDLVDHFRDDAMAALKAALSLSRLSGGAS